MAKKLSIGDLLMTYRGALVTRWVDKVQEKLPGENSLTRDEIINSMNLFLDELFRMLADDDTEALSVRRSAVARIHGGQRQILGRSVSELTREYGLMLEATVDLAAEKGADIPKEDMLELATYLFAGAAEAVDQFTQQDAEARRRADFENFAFVAHELRNPLGSIDMAWQILSSSVPENRATTVLSRGIRRISELIDNTLTSAKLQTLDAGEKLRREDVSMKDLLQDALHDSAVDADVKAISVAVDSHDVHLNGDPRLLRSAVSNLLRNAIKFTPTHGHVRVSCKTVGARVEIHVEDQCGGLAPGAAESLFGAFLQTNKDRSGFGLGLAIAKQAIDAHKGSIAVKNHPGIGCCFIVDLPAIEERSSGIPGTLPV